MLEDGSWKKAGPATSCVAVATGAAAAAATGGGTGRRGGATVAGPGGGRIGAGRERRKLLHDRRRAALGAGAWEVRPAAGEMLEGVPTGLTAVFKDRHDECILPTED